MRKEGLVVFYGTHDAIKADNICSENNIDSGLIPTHPSITLGCGFMLKTDWNNFSDLVKLLNDADLRYKALYYSEKNGIKRKTEMLYEDKEVGQEL